MPEQELAQLDRIERMLKQLLEAVGRPVVPTPLPVDISALANQMAPMVARMVVELMQGQQIIQHQPVLNEVERIKQQALQLARQGKRAESVELIKSLSRRSSRADSI